MANEFDGWHDRVYGDIELSYPPGEGKWHGDTYIFFHCRSTGFNGEVWGHAAMVLHAYMTGPWWPLIEPRLKQCGNHMGGDMSHQILALFKEDEQDRIDMQVMQMEAWLEKQRKITETGQRIVREMMSNLYPESCQSCPLTRSKTCSLACATSSRLSSASMTPSGSWATPTASASFTSARAMRPAT